MGLFEDLKSAASALREADKIPQYEKILDAQEQLLDMQKRITNLEEEKKRLKERLKISEDLEYKNNTYWTEKEESGNLDGPFCSRCWDAEKDLIRMHPCGNPDFHSCPHCDSDPVQTTPGDNPFFD